MVMQKKAKAPSMRDELARLKIENAQLQAKLSVEHNRNAKLEGKIVEYEKALGILVSGGSVELVNEKDEQAQSIYTDGQMVDNPYMTTIDYKWIIQNNLPEPYRSRLLYGDWAQGTKTVPVNNSTTDTVWDMPTP